MRITNKSRGNTGVCAQPEYVGTRMKLGEDEHMQVEGIRACTFQLKANDEGEGG